MKSLYSLWLLLHVLGLGLALGAATVKLVLLFRCRADGEFVPAFLKVARPVTRLIILGLILLTLSGIGWLITPGGYSFTPLLLTKLVLVLAVWILGPVIDNVVEPKFRQLVPPPGQAPSPAFVGARNRLMAVEAVATGLFYVITLLGVALT
jgi:hypothetical protein